MNTPIIDRKRPAENDLAKAIEPLVNYLCAVERPRAALALALAALHREVDQTNRAAIAHFRSAHFRADLLGR